MVDIALPGAKVGYLSGWLTAFSADGALNALLTEVPFSQHRVRMFGRELPAPRLSAWIGDPGAAYRYSRVRHEPLPWTPTLQALRERLQEDLGCAFNSVLVNRYRSGADSMGWHADDEAELGAEPVIASVSLGATRSMRFRSRTLDPIRLSLPLEHGSLLLMAGQTQALYQHAVDKTRAPVAERINLTFRLIRPVSGDRPQDAAQAVVA
ncbi:MAG: alpha-ketoglutarate-dependent dioxygenase AlkB [Lysobacterales bacterium]